MTVPVAYFIHRVQKPNRRLNLDRSYRWIRWLVDALPDVAICATWLPYCEALDEETYRARGLRDGEALAGLGGISVGIVCGPQISDGCKGDIENLAKKGIASVTLTDLGFEEPPPSEDRWPCLYSRVRETVGRAIATRGPVLWSVNFKHDRTFKSDFVDVFPEV